MGLRGDVPPKPANFRRGGARGRLMNFPCGERVAVPTQDAAPPPDWLTAPGAGLPVNESGSVYALRLTRISAGRTTRRRSHDRFASMRPGRCTVADLGCPLALSTAAIACGARPCLSGADRLPGSFKTVGHAGGQPRVFDLFRAESLKARESLAVLHLHHVSPSARALRRLNKFCSLHDGRCWVAPAGRRAVAGAARRGGVRKSLGSMPYRLGREHVALVTARSDRLQASLRRGLSREGRA